MTLFNTTSSKNAVVDGKNKIKLRSITLIQLFICNPFLFSFFRDPNQYNNIIDLIVCLISILQKKLRKILSDQNL